MNATISTETECREIVMITWRPLFVYCWDCCDRREWELRLKFYPAEGRNPLLELLRYVRQQRVWFWTVFGLRKGTDLTYVHDWTQVLFNQYVIFGRVIWHFHITSYLTELSVFWWLFTNEDTCHEKFQSHKRSILDISDRSDHLHLRPGLNSSIV